jgi:hypothetical protein
VIIQHINNIRSLPSDLNWEYFKFYCLYSNRSKLLKEIEYKHEIEDMPISKLISIDFKLQFKIMPYPLEKLQDSDIVRYELYLENNTLLKRSHTLCSDGRTLNELKNKIYTIVAEEYESPILGKVDNYVILPKDINTPFVESIPEDSNKVSRYNDESTVFVLKYVTIEDKELLKRKAILAIC